jgi:hypothetical protein
MAKKNTQPAPRRKVTAAAKTKANVQKAKRSAAMKKEAQVDPAADLIELENAARGMIQAARGIASVYRNQDFLSKLKDLEPMKRAGEALVNHLNSLIGQLELINAKRESLTNNDQLEVAMISIMVAEEYQQWMYQYAEVVQPIMNTIQGFIDEVEAMGSPDPTTEADVMSETSPKGPDEKKASATPPKQPTTKPTASGVDLMALARGKRG